jgi:NAD(P)-dependent dehydrogenase (short-subunit alcohol dehydrogenase family)
LLTSFKVNVVGNIHLFNLYVPLLLKGQAKKAVTLSTGMADPDFVSKFSISVSAPYSISKAAVNLAVSKFDAQYRKDGVLFMAISPGMVDTGHYDDGQISPERFCRDHALTALQRRRSRPRKRAKCCNSSNPTHPASLSR